MEFFSLIEQAVRKKINPLIAKIRKAFNLTYISNKVKVCITKLFTMLFDFKPKDKNDYYTFWGWMLAKKLAFTIIFAIVLVNVYILCQILPNSEDNTGGYKTYAYNSFGLKFYDGKVYILNENKNIAYEGSVEDGQVLGQGKLYDDAGILVYEGAFENSRYNGSGTLYEDGVMVYSGDFVDNIYQGEGILYRINGSKSYEGTFLAGKRHGEGELYNTNGNVVYTGNFVNDYLRYEDMIGKATSEVSGMYTGSKVVYTYDESFGVEMKEINALYVGAEEESLEEDGWPITGIYVLDQAFPYGNELYENVNDLEKVAGELLYEGSTIPEPMDAVAMKLLEDNGNVLLSEDLEISLSQFYDNSFEVESYDKKYVIYIYQYSIDGFMYTFFSGQSDGSFQMYLIEEIA